jgi:hypothetical protein
MGFAFADDFGVGFKQTQHFVLHVAVPLHHSFLGLPDHVLHQRKKVPQLANLGGYSQDCAHHFEAPESFIATRSVRSPGDET